MRKISGVGLRVVGGAMGFWALFGLVILIYRSTGLDAACYSSFTQHYCSARGILGGLIVVVIQSAIAWGLWRVGGRLLR